MRKIAGRKYSIEFFLVGLLVLCGCTDPSDRVRAALFARASYCTVVVEDCEGVVCRAPVLRLPKGSDFVFEVQEQDGYIVVGCSVQERDYDVSVVRSGVKSVTLTIPCVSYSTVVSLDVRQGGFSFFYDSNGGQYIGNYDRNIPVNVLPSHLRQNSAMAGAVCVRDGYSQI